MRSVNNNNNDKNVNFMCEKKRKFSVINQKQKRKLIIYQSPFTRREWKTFLYIYNRSDDQNQNVFRSGNFSLLLPPPSPLPILAIQSLNVEKVINNNGYNWNSEKPKSTEIFITHTPHTTSIHFNPLQKVLNEFLYIFFSWW